MLKLTPDLAGHCACAWLGSSEGALISRQPDEPGCDDDDRPQPFRCPWRCPGEQVLDDLRGRTAARLAAWVERSAATPCCHLTPYCARKRTLPEEVDGGLNGSVAEGAKIVGYLAPALQPIIAT